MSVWGGETALRGGGEEAGDTPDGPPRAARRGPELTVTIDKI